MIICDYEEIIKDLFKEDFQNSKEIDYLDCLFKYFIRDKKIFADWIGKFKKDEKTSPFYRLYMFKKVNLLLFVTVAAGFIDRKLKDYSSDTVNYFYKLIHDM